MKRLVTIVFALLISVAGLAQIEIITSGGGVGAVTLDNTATLYNKTLDGATTVFNGSSTQNFSVATLTYTWFNQSPSASNYRMLTLATYTSSADGGVTTLITGIPEATKVIGWTAMVFTDDLSVAWPQNTTAASGYQGYMFSTRVANGNFYIVNGVGSDSTYIRGKPVTMNIWYLQ